MKTIYNTVLTYGIILACSCQWIWSYYNITILLEGFCDNSKSYDISVPWTFDNSLQPENPQEQQI